MQWNRQISYAFNTVTKHHALICIEQAAGVGVCM